MISWLLIRKDLRPCERQPLEDGFEGTLARDIGATLLRLIKSTVIGMVAGTFLDILMGYFRHWERALVAPMNFLLAIWGTALFPLAMI